MFDLNLSYGLLSTYTETTFLCQAPNPATGWSLQLSRVVKHEWRGVNRGISVRKCIWYLANRANATHVAVNTKDTMGTIRSLLTYSVGGTKKAT